MYRSIFLVVIIAIFTVANVANAALYQCLKLNPSTVCSAVTGRVYNVAETTVNCDNQQITMVGICGSNTGTADVTTRDNISVSTTNTSNIYCWCMMIEPVPSRWVYRYQYQDAYNCKMQCAVGCNNAFVYDGTGDRSFRSAMISNLIQ
ncbi:MAG: hypothetical protein IKZ34_02270 [Alphaproteobacteria bacterium]|jgi:hypothetical protein|nr:hypothetical protein [Alphaproteobacteria bacterium]